MGTTLVAGRGAGAVLGVRIVLGAVVRGTERKGVLVGVLGFLDVIASRASDVVTGGAGRDIVDTGGLGRRGLELFCPSILVLEKPGRCRLRGPTTALRGSARVSAIVSGTGTSAGRAASVSSEDTLFVPSLLPTRIALVAAPLVRSSTG